MSDSGLQREEISFFSSRYPQPSRGIPCRGVCLDVCVNMSMYSYSYDASIYACSVDVSHMFAEAFKQVTESI